MLELTNLHKTFLPGTVNAHVALDGVSLHLAPGEFATVIGSNGAGKSTLFGAICGSFLCDAGRIRLGGRDITFLPEHARARSIGRVFQDPMKGTAPGMTIEENMALAYSRARNRPLSMALSKKRHDLFRDALARYGMGLEDRMKTRVGLLSGGQRQVVTLLMCTLVTPKLLLLDEHTAALDPATAARVMEITCQIVREAQITTLMITHNINAALSIGSRTIMMDSGSVILDIDGEARAQMSVERLMKLYSEKKSAELDNDRMLFNQAARPEGETAMERNVRP